MKKMNLLISVWVLFPALINAQEIGSLKVVMDGFRNDSGYVRIALANSRENYSEHDNIFRGVSVKIKQKHAACIFEDIPFGEYAVKVFHDENANGDLDTNFLGIPTEDYGFSNNASGTFGPPSWSAARFYFGAENDTIFITID